MQKYDGTWRRPTGLRCLRSELSAPQPVANNSCRAGSHSPLPAPSEAGSQWNSEPISRGTAYLMGLCSLNVELVAVDRWLRAAQRDRRQPQDAQVERGRPMVDIPTVEHETLRPVDVLAAVHLRPAGDAGLDLQAAAILG